MPRKRSERGSADRDVESQRDVRQPFTLVRDAYPRTNVRREDEETPGRRRGSRGESL